MKRDEKPILIAVDSPIYLKMWEKILKPLGICHFYMTQDAESAIALMRRKPAEVLVSEVVLDKYTGYDLAKVMQANHPEARIVLTTTFDCDLTRFDLNDPHFHILYKPYKDMKEIERFILRIILEKNPREGVDEDSVSENESFPSVLEWKL